MNGSKRQASRPRAGILLRPRTGILLRARTRLTGAGWGGLLVAQSVLSVLLAGLVTVVWAATPPHYLWPRWVWFGLGVNLATQYALRRALRRPAGRGRAFAVQAALSAVYVALDVTVWSLSGGGLFWPGFSIPVVAAALAVSAWWMRHEPPARIRELAERVDVLSRTRSGALDVQAAELRRIERDLHDGAQARMVSLAMNLGLASELLARDPAAVAELLVEARATTLAALDDLRTVMEGIQPPVLADRGLVGAVEALAIDLALPVTVTADVPGRLEPPVETAVYFAVAECLANTVKHSRAKRVWVTLEHRAGSLTVLVGDDGAGGAGSGPVGGSRTGPDFRRGPGPRPDSGSGTGSGTGLSGVARRLEVFDGTLAVDSPAGGPTLVTMEVRCALSSPRISPSSGTD